MGPSLPDAHQMVPTEENIALRYGLKEDSVDSEIHMDQLHVCSLQGTAHVAYTLHGGKNH